MTIGASLRLKDYTKRRFRPESLQQTLFEYHAA